MGIAPSQTPIVSLLTPTIQVIEPPKGSNAEGLLLILAIRPSSTKHLISVRTVAAVTNNKSTKLSTFNDLPVTNPTRLFWRSLALILFGQLARLPPGVQ